MSSFRAIFLIACVTIAYLSTVGIVNYNEQLLLSVSCFGMSSWINSLKRQIASKLDQQLLSHEAHAGNLRMFEFSEINCCDGQSNRYIKLVSKNDK